MSLCQATCQISGKASGTNSAHPQILRGISLILGYIMLSKRLSLRISKGFQMTTLKSILTMLILFFNMVLRVIMKKQSQLHSSTAHLHIIPQLNKIDQETLNSHFLSLLRLAIGIGLGQRELIILFVKINFSKTDFRKFS